MDTSFDPKNEIQEFANEKFYQDVSLWSLILANVLVMLIAVFQKWPLAPLLWVYWAQSVAIGILWFVKMLSLREFSTEGYKIKNQSVEPTPETKRKIAFFFLAHYGFFHLGYFVFIFHFSEHLQFMSLSVAIAPLVVAQSFSFFYNKKWRTPGKPNIGALMFFPYARIIPMHLTIIFGGAILNASEAGESEWGVRLVILLFMLLKTLADVIMHIVEKIGFTSRPEKSTS